MGSSESKLAPSQVVKPQPAAVKSQISHLIDPRSPSTDIDRTPIQVDALVSKTSAELRHESQPALCDPRSPSTGINRTPVREVMRATVGSFARRLGMFLHLEAERKSTDASQDCSHDGVEEADAIKSDELVFTEPLLSPQLPDSHDSLAEHAKLLVTPVTPLVQSAANHSPFVLLEEPQLEVEVETEVDISLDDAEEATESPLHKRLSMSLIAYHEGATSSHIFAEENRESTASPEPLGDGVDHSYARPALTVDPEPSVVTEPQVQASPSLPEEAQSMPSAEAPEEKDSEASPILKQTQDCSGIRCPSFDSKSPSQVVFKPQWLGKGFGASGMRAKVEHRGKGGSSPLAVRVAVKKVTNENKGHSGKLKQKAMEGRSPLQILKDTNSPREQLSQTKLKVSTPDKQRLGQMDRRVLAVSLDKENR